MTEPLTTNPVVKELREHADAWGVPDEVPDAFRMNETAMAWACWRGAAEIDRLTAEVAELRRDAEAKRAALLGAVDCIREWHNAGLHPGERSHMWDIYWRNAPEMKAIRAALGEQP